MLIKHILSDHSTSLVNTPWPGLSGATSSQTLCRDAASGASRGTGINTGLLGLASGSQPDLSPARGLSQDVTISLQQPGAASLRPPAPPEAARSLVRLNKQPIAAEAGRGRRSDQRMFAEERQPPGSLQRAEAGRAYPRQGCWTGQHLSRPFSSLSSPPSFNTEYLNNHQISFRVLKFRSLLSIFTACNPAKRKEGEDTDTMK